MSSPEGDTQDEVNIASKCLWQFTRNFRSSVDIFYISNGLNNLLGLFQQDKLKQMYFSLVFHTAFSRYSSNFYALEQTHGSRERKKICKTYLWVVQSRIVNYFQIFPPLVFSYRLSFSPTVEVFRI